MLILGAWSIHIAFRRTGGDPGSNRQRICRHRLWELQVACEFYASRNEGAYPPRLRDLVPDVLPDAYVLQCPGGKQGTQYSYESSLHRDMPEHFILIYDDSLENHEQQGRNVLTIGGYTWWPASEEALFQKALAQQRRWIRKEALKHHR